MAVESISSVLDWVIGVCLVFSLYLVLTGADPKLISAMDSTTVVAALCQVLCLRIMCIKGGDYD